MTNQKQQKIIDEASLLEVKRSIPEELQGITLDVDSISDVRNERYLLSFDFDGKQDAHAIPDDACVMSPKKLLKAINEPNGIYVETEELAAFAVATIQRLKQRHAYHLERGNAEWIDQTTQAMELIAEAVELKPTLIGT